MCLHISLVSLDFTSRSTAFESFSKGIFDLLVMMFFHLLKYLLHKSEMKVSIKRTYYGDLPSQVAISQVR